MPKLCWNLIFILLIKVSPSHGNTANLLNRSFVIDYNNNQFAKDGAPFRYISGSVHYFKTPRYYWQDRLVKLRAMGCNAVQTYVWWGMHEQYQNKYNFRGDRNVFKFLEIAQHLNLLAILRIGPYIDDVVDMGGMPAWLLKYPHMFLRTSNVNFMAAVRKWFSVLLPKLRPFLYANGGPIIMLQLENEYGSYFHTDSAYGPALLKLAEQYLGRNVVYFTTDGAGVSYLQKGTIPGVYPTIDFGPVRNKSEVKNAFAVQRKFAPRGPLVNSEFYTGWFDKWFDQHQRRPTSPILNTIEYMWSLNASFNMFMVYGGTQWGFQAGGENFEPFQYTYITTSFDCDSPITEAGDVTVKYLKIRKLLEQLSGSKNPFPVPKPVQKIAYGRVNMAPIGTVIDLLHLLTPPEKVISSDYPLTMEQLDHYFGFVLYETVVISYYIVDIELVISGLRDRGYVYLNGNLVEIVQRNETVKIRSSYCEILQILVENQGRICYGEHQNDSKGILQNVTADGEVLRYWDIYPINFDALLKSEAQPTRANFGKFQPTIFSGQFAPQILADTFLDTTNWGKGVAFINGHNLGRYWSVAGPQQTLYVPKSFLKPVTKLVILELEPPVQCLYSANRRSCDVSFVDKPKWS